MVKILPNYFQGRMPDQAGCRILKFRLLTRPTETVITLSRIIGFYGTAKLNPSKENCIQPFGALTGQARGPAPTA